MKMIDLVLVAGLGVGLYVLFGGGKVSFPGMTPFPSSGGDSGLTDPLWQAPNSMGGFSAGAVPIVPGVDIMGQFVSGFGQSIT